MKHKYGVLSKKSQEAEEHFQIRVNLSFFIYYISNIH